MRDGIINEMKGLGYRFSGVGGGRILFDRIGLPGVDRREFKSWDDVLAFVKTNMDHRKEC